MLNVSGLTSRKSLRAVYRLLEDAVPVSAALLAGAVAMAGSRERLPIQDSRLRTMVAAGVGVAAGAVADALLNSIPSPGSSSYTVPSLYGDASTGWPVPQDGEEARRQLTKAITEGAAPRAATHSHLLDPSFGMHYLGATGRWKGYPDGSAVFFVGPGLFLQCTFSERVYSPLATFTLIWSDGREPVEIRSLEQLRALIDAEPAAAAAAAAADSGAESGSEAGDFAAAPDVEDAAQDPGQDEAEAEADGARSAVQPG
jgi:hypothetical protein